VLLHLVTQKRDLEMRKISSHTHMKCETLRESRRQPSDLIGYVDEKKRTLPPTIALRTSPKQCRFDQMALEAMSRNLGIIRQLLVAAINKDMIHKILR
jgi:hypothetical protein